MRLPRQLGQKPRRLQMKMRHESAGGTDDLEAQDVILAWVGGKPRTWRREAVMSTASKPLGKAMYVAPRPDWDWLRSAQRALYARSEKDTAYVFRKLWGLVTDPRNLRMALARVASNRGRRTAGVDGITVARLANRTDAFIAEVRAELRSGAYRPSPVRRVLIPKIGAPGKFRPLGIPTVKDRVVQAALKNILEPVFEADFFPVSFGFRPGKSVHEALEHIRVLLRPKGDERPQRHRGAIRAACLASPHRAHEARHGRSRTPSEERSEDRSASWTHGRCSHSVCR